MPDHAQPAGPLNEHAAVELDRKDPLSALRNRFRIPDSPALHHPHAAYFSGNSLGCMPRDVPGAFEQELDDWARLAVEGHLEARHPWYSYHENFRESGARLVGARPGEVVMMNSLTANLHFLMVSFYRPTRDRYRIVVEDDCFSSDSYAVQTQTAFHGFDPADAVIRLKPRAGERTLRTEDIIETIESRADSIALVMLAGVNYLTGQWFDMPAITAAARAKGITVGWDLAHAAGNVPMSLHDWDVDFAAWCNYKYLNAGPGAIAGAFVHERHSRDASLPRFAGWWGNDPATRFEMSPDFVPKDGVEAWQVSNPSIMSMIPLRISMGIFDEIGMPALRERSVRLTASLERSVDAIGKDRISIVTPRDPARRGCQLSLAVRGDVRQIQSQLKDHGVIADLREPDVIRVAPVPMYNSFHDIWRLGQALREGA